MVQAKLDKMQKMEIVTPLNVELAALGKAAMALGLPEEKDRQPDLQYLTAIFVSSGMNKNGAVFLGSELIKAAKSISNKAVDIEHDEQKVVGHINNSVYLTRDGSQIDIELASTQMSMDEQDASEMDVAISATIYKNRFPDLADEINSGQWMVSMEAYFRDYDVKVGDMIIPRDQAAALGYDKLIGSVVKVKDGAKEVGYHLVGRVLRDIIFAGVGVVKNPANERSVILESASLQEYIEKNKETASVINLADITTIEKGTTPSLLSTPPYYEKLIDDRIKEVVKEVVKEEIKELKKDIASDDHYNFPGQCVAYQRFVYAPATFSLEEPPTDLSQYPLVNPAGPDGRGAGTELIREHYCSLFDADCTARPGDASRPTCLRNVLATVVRDELLSQEEITRVIRLNTGLVELQRLIDEARKFRQ